MRSKEAFLPPQTQLSDAALKQAKTSGSILDAALDRQPKAEVTLLTGTSQAEETEPLSAGPLTGAVAPQPDRIKKMRATTKKSEKLSKPEQVAEQGKRQPWDQVPEQVQQKTAELAPGPAAQTTAETTLTTLQVDVAKLRIAPEELDEGREATQLNGGSASQLQAADQAASNPTDQGPDNSQPVVQERGYRSAQPRYAVNPKPEYPRVAKLRGWQGDVLFQVEVLATGQVGSVSMVASSGYRSLDRAAQKALRRWVFKPATNMGVPVASEVRIPIRFALKK